MNRFERAILRHFFVLLEFYCLDCRTHYYGERLPVLGGRLPFGGVQGGSDDEVIVCDLLAEGDASVFIGGLRDDFWLLLVRGGGLRLDL